MYTRQQKKGEREEGNSVFKIKYIIFVLILEACLGHICGPSKKAGKM
jgi:hypothetical protein